MSQYQDIHIPIKVWLQTIALPEYQPYFGKFNGAQELFDITEKEVSNLGIQNFDHRTRIVASLRLLGTKCRGSMIQGAIAAFDKGAVLPSATRTKLMTAEERKKLEAELNSELQLPSSDLRSSAWFHGKISREYAESMVKQAGEFLVRESVSQQGLCVLTCNHQGQPLHFVVNRFFDSSSNGSTEYGFESSRFSTVQALILSHVTDGAVITEASGAKIRFPVNRKLPLRQIEADNRREAIPGRDSPDYEATSPSPRRYWQSATSPRGQTVGRSGSPKGVLPRQEKSLGRSGSAPLLDELDTGSPAKLRSSPPPSSKNLAVPEPSIGSKAYSDGELNASPSQLPHRSADIKLSRNTSAAHPVIAIRNRALYDEGADYSDYFEVKRMPDQTKNGVTDNQSGDQFQHRDQSKPDTLQSSSAQSSANQSAVISQSDGVLDEDYDTPSSEVREIHNFTTPLIPPNYVDASSFSSALITDLNKPLDPNCMFKMKEALMQVNHQVIAQHITYLDLHLLKVVENHNLGAGIFSGVEALTLPQGHHFRQAALERHCCLSFVVSVTVLACTDDLMERSKMVKQWILIARELHRAHGNLFSFAAIMHGLSATTLERLIMTWNILERVDPVLMNQWKTKLKPNYKELLSPTNSLASDHISIPNVTPICEALENEESAQWDRDGSDLVLMLAQLDLARLMASQSSFYSRKGVAILRFFVPRPDLRDLFKVELHMRLLFGHRGALAQRAERRVKFEQILSILSVRAENNDIGTEF